MTPAGLLVFEHGWNVKRPRLFCLDDRQTDRQTDLDLDLDLDLVYLH